MCKLGYVMNSNEACPWILIRSRSGGAVGKSVRTTSGRFGVRIQDATDLSRKKQVVTAQLPNARHLVTVSRVLEDDHYKRTPLASQSRCGTLKNPHCSMAMSAKHMSKFLALTGYGYLSIWVKNSRVGRKPPPPKKKKKKKNKKKLCGKGGTTQPFVGC